MLAAVTVELPTGGFGRRGYRYVTGWALGAGKLSAELGSPPIKPNGAGNAAALARFMRGEVKSW